MKKILITGANGNLGGQLCCYLKKQGHGVCCTARDQQKLDEVLRDTDVDSTSLLDLMDRESICDFHKWISGLEIDAIVHVASPFAGSLRDSGIEDIGGWANLHFGALVLAKKLTGSGGQGKKLILIGSVAGTLNRTSTNYPLYSAYKGSLRLLAEVVRHEGVLGYYLNLGGFREDGDGYEHLSTETVIKMIVRLLESEEDFGVQVDLMTPKEAERYV